MINHSRNLWSVLRRREVVSICLFVFMTDMIIGTISPTLSLFAQSLGASLTLVGILATTLGLARLGSSIVIGTLSDRRGRKNILLTGMGLMGLTTLLYTLTTRPEVLVLLNIMFGASFVATLTVGLAYAADVVSARERSLVFGLATTAMGLGFAVGSFIGGRVAASWGYPGAYSIALGVAVAAVVVVWWGVPGQPSPAQPTESTHPSWPQQMRVMISNRVILAACVGAILSNLVFGGLVVTFFPIYAFGLGISKATIGSLFATRALASTLARLPAGVLGTIFPADGVMLTALVISTLVAFFLPQFANPALLMFLLLSEGVAYGLFLTTGQTTVAEHANPAGRGAALGVYMAAASIGDSVAPLFLGLLADHLGIKSVFYVVGSLALLGVMLMARILMRRRVELSGCAQE